MSDDREWYDSCLTALVGLMLLPVSLAWHGWVLTILWEWFVIPLGLEPITLYQAAAFFVVKGFAFGRISTIKKEYEKPFGEQAFSSFFHPAFYLFIGWVLWRLA